MRGVGYKTLAESLREQIHAGAFPVGRRLPTDAELGRDFQVSRQTVRQAFSELVAEGLVYRVPGRGSFAVTSPSSDKYLRSLGSVEDLLALAVDTELEVVHPFATTIDVAAAGRLQLASDEVAVGTFRRLHQGEPFSLTTMYLPPERADRIARDPRIAEAGARSKTTVIGLLEADDGTPLAGAHQSISAALADGETAALIDCNPGEPILTVDRIYFDREGRFVELAVSSFNVRRYSYRLELRRSTR